MIFRNSPARTCLLSLVVLLVLLFTGIFVSQKNQVDMAAWLIGLSTLGLMVWLFCYGYFVANTKDLNRSKLNGLSLRATAKQLLLIALLCAIVYLMLSAEEYIYFWDYGNYWSRSVEFSKVLFERPLDALNYMLYSINTDENNYLLPLLLAAPLHAFGASYQNYCFFSFVIFLLPCYFAVNLLTKKLARLLQLNSLPSWSVCIFFLLNPLALRALLHGYCDIAAVWPALLILAIFADWEFEHIDYPKCIIITLLIIFISVSRRYFTIWVAGFVIGLLVFLLFKIYVKQDKKERIVFVKNFIVSMLVIGTLTLAIFLCFFFDFIKMSLTGNFAKAFVSYQAGLGNAFLSALKYIGLVVLIPMGLGIVLLIKNKITTLYAYIGFIICSMLATMLLFFRIQKMGEHHHYLLLPQVSVLAILGLLFLYNIKNIRQKMLAMALVISSFMIDYAVYYSVIPSTGMNQHRLWAPRVRNDIPVLHQLADRINQLNIGGDPIYILASSYTLNDNIMQMLNYPESMLLNLAKHSQSDLLDGFPTDFLKSKVVVVAIPIQLHLAPGTQKVIEILAKNMLDESSAVGRHYQQVDTFELDGKVTANVYVRQDEMTQEEIDFLIGEYNQFYSDYPELFQDRLEAFKVEMNGGEAS